MSKSTISVCATALVACCCPTTGVEAQSGVIDVRVERLLDAPTIFRGIDASIGANIQGPSLIKVPDWSKTRLVLSISILLIIRASTSGWPTPTTYSVLGKSTAR
ncbi:MAG: hypothetical protein Ct9H300mP25_17030 [Acidobacteriota bacterium]|nr:MAG: hypothetical protein Ct9H300mP25_17030 [Acidobacteriota bacterium]